MVSSVRQYKWCWSFVFYSRVVDIINILFCEPSDSLRHYKKPLPEERTGPQKKQLIRDACLIVLFGFIRAVCSMIIQPSFSPKRSATAAPAAAVVFISARTSSLSRYHEFSYIYIYIYVVFFNWTNGARRRAILPKSPPESKLCFGCSRVVIAQDNKTSINHLEKVVLLYVIVAWVRHVVRETLLHILCSLSRFIEHPVDK